MRRYLAGALLIVATTPIAARAQCSPNAAQVVDDVYQQILERPADPAAGRFVQALGTGELSVRDVVAAVAKSDEHRVRFFLRPVVIGVYREMMRRDPSPAELQSAASELDGGGESVDHFVAHTALRAVNNRPDAVRMLYVMLLGREPDPIGLRNYTEAAQQQGLEAVAESLMQSQEYRARTRDNTAMFEPGVRALYQHLLGRQPDPSGLQQSMQLASVYGLDAVVDRIIGSREYLQQFGQDAVPGRRPMRFCGSEDTAIPRDTREATPREPRVWVPRDLRDPRVAVPRR